MRGQLPQKLVERLTQQFGPTTFREIERAFSVRRLPIFRVNTLKATDEQIMELMREQNIAFERVKNVPHAFKVKNKSNHELLELPITQQGLIYLQGITSMLPPLFIEPQPREAILDLCAAPGSKTTQLAALCLTSPYPLLNQGGDAMRQRSTRRFPLACPERNRRVEGGDQEGVSSCHILAVEENAIRYQKLVNSLETQGASNVETRHGDSTQLHKEFPESFDKVLADVPCSAEGRIDLNDPRSYKYWSEKNIVAHAKLQRRLLRSAVACLKPGGTLVYSTCTLAPEENEKMIEWLVAEFPQMKPVEISVPLKGSRKTAFKTFTVLPTDEAEGFFVAKLKKV